MTLFRITLHDKTDEQLMELFATRGSERAFEELYRRHASRFKGFFMRMLAADGALADDFLQELFLRIYQARESYRQGSSFSTWAFTIAYNLCRNEYRRRDVAEGYACEQREVATAEAGELPDFESRYDRTVFYRQLKRALAVLTAEQRAAYTLRYEEELSVQEIARILHCPEGTVKSRLFYALKLLKQALADYKPKTD